MDNWKDQKNIKKTARLPSG